MRERLPLLAGLTLLALAVGLGSVFIADGIRDRNRNDVISVTGSAKKRIRSDYVIWNSSITSTAPTAPAAEKQLATWTEEIRSFFHDERVSDDELSLQPISVQVPGDSGPDGETLKDYRLTRSFEVRSSQVAAIAGVAERSSKLLQRGIPIAVQSPQYVFTKLAGLRPGLLASATKDAQQRARVLVDASGAKLGDLRAVDVGVFQVTSPNSTDVSDYGVYDTATVAKDVTAVVNVTFALK